MSVSAVAVFQGTGVNGVVNFIKKGKYTHIYLNIHGLSKNGAHGFHIHEYGDLTDGCNSCCSHYNPYKKTHGCPGMRNRHVGDLGNIYTDNNGVARYTFRDDLIKLTGKHNIIGRGLVIHEKPDDCGLGQGHEREESLKTGNAGKRIACAVIGLAKQNC